MVDPTHLGYLNWWNLESLARPEGSAARLLRAWSTHMVISGKRDRDDSWARSVGTPTQPTREGSSILALEMPIKLLLPTSQFTYNLRAVEETRQPTPEDSTGPGAHRDLVAWVTFEGRTKQAESR